MIIPYSPDLGKVSMLTNIPWLLQIYFATYPPHSVLLTISHFSFQYIFLSCHPVLSFSLFLHSPISLNFAFLSTFLLSFYLSPFQLSIYSSFLSLPPSSSLSFLIYSSSIFFPFASTEKSIRTVWCWNANLPQSYINQTLPPRQKREEELLSCLEVEEQLSVL